MKLPKQLTKLLKKLEKQPDYVRIALMLVIAYGIYYLFKQLRWGIGNNIYLEGFGNGDFKDKTFVFFKMKGCGHCKAMQSEWDTFVRNHSVSSTGVKTSVVESNKNPELCKKYNVQGFPTLLMIKDNAIVKAFEGERTASALEAFAKN